jgi:hypothetical protein
MTKATPVQPPARRKPDQDRTATLITHGAALATITGNGPRERARHVGALDGFASGQYQRILLRRKSEDLIDAQEDARRSVPHVERGAVHRSRKADARRRTFANRQRS